jgi:DNA polymerase I-like protein with 3'-5' exonuclease and polymerase domains
MRSVTDTIPQVWIPENEADCLALRSVIKDRWVVGLDTETRPLNPKAKEPNALTDDLVGVGLAFYDDSDESNVRPTLLVYGLATTEPYLILLREVLAKRRWYAHNAMFDATVLSRYDVVLGEHVGDPRIIAYLLGEPEADLKGLLSRIRDIEVQTFHEVLDEYGVTTIADVPVEAQARYCAAQDAGEVVVLERQMRRDLDERVLDVYRKIELPTVSLLVEMSRQGIRFNRKRARELETATRRRRDGLDLAIDVMVKDTGFIEYEKQKTCRSCHNGKNKKLDCEPCTGTGYGPTVERRFNTGSWQQRGRFLYEHLRVPKRRFTGGVKPWMIRQGLVDAEELAGSTDRLAMLQVRDAHPVIGLMLTRSKVAKEEGFLRRWVELSETDGRLHTTFTNTTVVSGRLSSREPNLHQVELKFRDMLEADEETVLLSADYTQLEIVIAAFVSQDPAMVTALRDGKSLHMVTAQAIYGDDVSKDSPQYTNAKVTNFLTQYGGQVDKLIEGIEKIVLENPDAGLVVPTRAEANRFIKVHHQKYSRYWEWTRWTVLRTRDLGYSETVFGRRRFFPDITSAHNELRTEAERAAVNLVIQGTAADLMKMVMNNIRKDTVMQAWGQMVLQVHDELVCLVQKKRVDEYATRMRWQMEAGQPFLPVVPLRVDIGIGPNWKDTHKI